MSIERSNPDSMYQPFGDNYTQVIRSTGSTQVHVAGTLAANEDRDLVGEGDIRTQTRQIMQNIETSLEEFGAGPSDVVRISVYALDLDDYLENGLPELLEFFGDHKPVSTTVGVDQLAAPGYLVEIEATAVIEA